MEALLSSNRDYNDGVKRNIVSLRHSEDLFDDLSEGDLQQTQLAQALEAQVKHAIPIGSIPRGFHYTTAIEYPFTIEPYLASRYGNGTYPVWYGSLDLQTTIHETCHHMVKEERKIEGQNEIIYRERAVYDMNCQALLIDLVGKETDYPDLIKDGYTFTQTIGQRLYEEGHPGLLAPSARAPGGENIAVFRQSTLSNPRVMCYLNYAFDPIENTVQVEREPGVELMTLSYPR